MNAPAKTARRKALYGAVIILALATLGLIPLKHVQEFVAAEDVKGYWASLQDFAHKNGRYPLDDAEIRTFFRETPEQMKREPVQYIPPRDINTDEVVLWRKKTTLFGVKVGITESGMIVKQLR